MRLLKYITASGQLSEILKRDCNKYLTEIGARSSKTGWLYRGISDANIMDTALGVTRFQSQIKSGRIPRAAGYIVHNLFNDIGKEVFGWPIRNGVSTTSDFGRTVFGKMYIFLPIGDYKYVYSPGIRDFNSDQDLKIAKIISNGKNYSELREIFLSVTVWNSVKSEDMFNDRLKQIFPRKRLNYDMVYKKLYPYIKKYIIENYKDGNIKTAIDEKVETCFNSEEYYLVTDKILFADALDEGGWTL